MISLTINLAELPPDEHATMLELAQPGATFRVHGSEENLSATGWTVTLHLDQVTP